MTEKKQKKILITGATGLIGQGLVRYAHNLGMEIVAVTRNKEKAARLFSDIDDLEILETDIVNMPAADMSLDYIIHAAANTDSRTFVEKPVEIISENIAGMRNVLELSRANNTESLVFLSSMEVYGTQKDEDLIDEKHASDLDTMNARFCYPESKRMCENMCASYAAEYNVPAKVVRLTQSFGPGVLYNDKRVFAEFARCVIEGRDIVLHTKGETRRMYLYTEDACSAVFTVLLKGKTGEAYNAANENTYCSIYDMAVMVADKCAHNSIKVIVEETDISKYGYAPTLKMKLDTSKLKSLGWKPTTQLDEMFDLMIEDMRKAK